jgi:hypothetical protein
MPLIACVNVDSARRNIGAPVARIAGMGEEAGDTDGNPRHDSRHDPVLGSSLNRLRKEI